MAQAVIARQLGDDYQAGLFWFQACGLFLPHTKIIEVGFEVDQPKGFDDISVRYDPAVPDGRAAHVVLDFFQSKYHVSQTGWFTYQALTEPSFINADTVSLLQRFRDAHRQSRRLGVRSRFTVVSPWAIRPGDQLQDLRDHVRDGLRLDRLAEGKTARHRMGAVRKLWREHLELASDEELLDLMGAFRLSANSPNFEKLRQDVSDRMCLAGLRPPQADRIGNPYDDLIRKALAHGLRKFTRETLLELVQQEGLWVGQPSREEDRPRIVAVRSFSTWTERIADEADVFLDLLPFFSGRQILDDRYWAEEIWPQLERFLHENLADEAAAIELHLEAHSSVAFAAGFALRKAPTAVSFAQRIPAIGKLRWLPTGTLDGLPEELWKMEVVVRPGGDPGEMAVAMSVTHDASPDVMHFLDSSQSPVGTLLHFTPTTGIGQMSVRDGAHAWALSEQLTRVVRAERKRRTEGSAIHIFAAAPNALMFFLGQHGLALGSFQLYEYDFDGGALGAYVPSLRLPPVVHPTDSADRKDVR